MRDLDDDYTPVRIRAIKTVAEQNIQEAVPTLVYLLAYDDGAVRFYAIQALEQMTGKTHGYDWRAEDAERQAAIERWLADETIFGAGDN